MMDLALLLLVSVLAIIVLYLVREFQHVRTDLQNQASQLQQTVSQRFDANVQAVTNHLGIITGQITNTTNVVAQVEGKLGQMQEATRQIFDLARQVSSLQDILQSPKMRGGLGEFLLSDMLSQCLQANAYALQHRFSTGTIVDAALFVGKMTLCIDSKFPLENFRKMYQTEMETEKKSLRKLFLSDVKKHINDIAEKYILPQEGTLDFAMMFIPAENVYYELIVRDENDLYEHCLSRKVIPVSPNTFYAYLQVIIMGLRGFQISEQAKQILSQLQQVGNDLSNFGTDFARIGTHLRNAQNSFQQSDQRLQKIREKIEAMGKASLSNETEIALPAESAAVGSESPK